MSDLPLPEPVATDEALGIQHDTDPEQDHGPARHIPHIGHALLFFSLALTLTLLLQMIVVLAVHATNSAEAHKHLFAFFVAQTAAYVLTLAVCVWLFPRLWHRSFSAGISWTARAVRQRWWLFVLLGCAASQAALFSERFFKAPGDPEIRQLLQTPLTGWTVVLTAGVLFPLMEEIGFRGFLLPAFATAYDWLTLERTPAAHQAWQRSSANSLPALVFASVFSSIPFALLHAPQLQWSHGALAVLFCASLLFSAIRVWTRSLAAATVAHIAYDGLLLIQIAWLTHGFHHPEKLM